MNTRRTINRALMALLAALVSVTAMPAFAQPAARPEGSFRAGLKHYAKEDYQSGLDAFSAAITNMSTPPSFDVALAHYNRGVGLYRLSRPEEAAAAFAEALRTPDIELQHRAYFNLGNAHHQRARQLLDEGDVAGSFRLFQQASTNFMESLRREPDDRDAKINYELCIAAQIRILQMVATAMSRLQQGERMVGEYRFVEAAQWFQQNLPMVEKALALEPEMKKQFETMTERTTAVAEIIAPSAGGSP